MLSPQEIGYVKAKINNHNSPRQRKKTRWWTNNDKIKRTIALTHCRLNRLPYSMYRKSPISIFGTSGYEIRYSCRKMAKPCANSGDPDQTSRSVVSDLGLQCLSITLLGVSRLQCVNLKHVPSSTGTQTLLYYSRTSMPRTSLLP